jgi:pimeloyl-ACP methyl ester carboxylesterase
VTPPPAATPVTIEAPLADGRRLEATIHGTGAPTVVFEAGMGMSRRSWALVAPAVGERTQAVTYDRAGFGRSTVDPADRTVARAASDLVGLLEHLDAGPVVLVGHSYGGPIVRQAHAIAPERVAGLVLVDATDEGCDLLVARTTGRQERIFAAAIPVMARLGLTAMIARRVARALPPEERRAFGAEAGSVAAARAHRRELVVCGADLRRLRDEPHPPVDVPITLISGAGPTGGVAATRRRDCLVAAHRRRADASARGRHVRAEQSGHMVMLSEPDLVVDEIMRLVEEVTPPA